MLYAVRQALLSSGRVFSSGCFGERISGPRAV